MLEVSAAGSQANRLALAGLPYPFTAPATAQSAYGRAISQPNPDRRHGRSGRLLLGLPPADEHEYQAWYQ